MASGAFSGTFFGIEKNWLSIMKIAIESPAELTDSYVEEVIDIWSTKSRRITV